MIAGTCAEYEWRAARLHETATPRRPATLYGVAKDGLHKILEAYAVNVGCSLAWGRIFFLYGPDEKPGRLVSDAIQTLLAGERFQTTAGNQLRDFMHVMDVAAAFVILLEANIEGPVNIGSGEAVPVRVLLERIGEETGRRELIAFGEKALAPTEPPVIEADNRRLTEELGFVSRYNLHAGLLQTLAWWRGKQKILPLDQM